MSHKFGSAVATETFSIHLKRVFVQVEIFNSSKNVFEANRTWFSLNRATQFA